jgi:hypothetical protein
MRAGTRNRMEEFHSFPWFQNVGRPKSADVLAAQSWDEATKYCSAGEWESVQLQVNNQLATRVNRTDYPRFQNWNPTVANINAKLESLVNERVAPVALRNNLPMRFQQAVAWDLMEICLETEFQDICEPIFFINRVLPWYKKGHFPCGWDGPLLEEKWDGVFPNGLLIVF